MIGTAWRQNGWGVLGRRHPWPGGRMKAKVRAVSAIDMEKFRLRRFVDGLIALDEVEVHPEPVPLTGLSTIVERTPKAVLFKQAGPEQVEIAAKTAGSRKRLAAAFATSEDRLGEEYFKPLGNPQPLVQVPNGGAPVHEVAVTRGDLRLTQPPRPPPHA